MKSFVKAAIVSTSLLSVFFLTQNCGTTKNVNHTYPQSPFEENKILLSQDFAIQEKLVGPDGNDLVGTASIPANTELSVIVRDKCIVDRRVAAPIVPFWVDAYITKDTPIGNGTDIYSETAVGIVTKVPFTVDDLNSYAKLDPCIVGISNTVKIAYRAATDSVATQQDLLSSLQFAAGDAIFKNEIADTFKVRVAILDSGLDYTNTALSAKVDPNYTTFYNFLGTMRGEAATSEGNQDVFGTGTQLASLIAGDIDRNFTGLASRNVVLLPIKIRNHINQTFGSYHYLNMIKLAVNMRADVINLATSDVEKGCDPIVGHAMLQAIRRNSFMVLSAGDNIEPNPALPRRPGAFVTVKDNGPLYTGVTVAPGCWGRYLKGAIAVGASNATGTALTSFSNWGEDAVELVAPGLSVRAVHNNKTVVNSDSILLPTAMVSAAAAMTIAYHKSKAWSYDPWLIEDVMLNSFPSKTGIISKIRNGKFLSFSTLASYLKALELKTPEQRLAETTDNPELNGGWNAGSAIDANLMSIDVYAKNPLIQVNSRLQLNTVAYYRDAVIKVITEAGTTYTSSNTAIATVNGQGVVVAKTPGTVTITAKYNDKQATASMTVVNYDVIEGPGNDLVELELTNEFNPMYGVCPVSNSGVANTVFYPNVYAHFGDGSRTPLINLASIAAPSPIEIASGVYGQTVAAGNWYGGRTYTIYALYRGQQAKLDIIAPKAAYRRLTLDFANIVSGDANRLTNGETLSITQDKSPALHARIEINDECRHFPIKGDVGRMSPSEVLSSPDADLNQQLKAFAAGWNSTLNLYALTVGKTYQVNVNYGIYRGNGVQEVLPNQTYYFKILPPDIQDLKLVENNYADVPNPFPLGRSLVQIQMTDSAGQKQIVAPSQFSAQYIERGTGRLLKAPEGISTLVTGVGMYIWLFPPTGEALDVDLMLTHLQTGFKKTIPLTARGLGRYSGTDANAPAFNWNNFSISSMANMCPSGATTPLSGTGTSGSPYVVCSAQQLVNVGLLTTEISKAPYVVLGGPINFSATVLPNKSLIYHSVDGGGKTISNITYASADEAKEVFVGENFSNVVVSDFSISTRSLSFFAGRSFENIRFQKGMLIATDGRVSIMSNATGGSSVRNVRNIRIEDVELQGTSHIGSINPGQVLRVDNFGARNLILRSSSVAGTGSFVGGIVPSCQICTIISSSTSGTISQVANLVGGIGGHLTAAKLISTTSNMNIAATGDMVGGLVGQMRGVRSYPETQDRDGLDISWSLIQKSSFNGTVRGSNSIGGIVGMSEGTTIDTVSVGSTALVQGLDYIGGVIGRSEIFNRIYDATVDAQLHAQGPIHFISNSIRDYSFTFRPADRFLNLKYKGQAVVLDPAVIAPDLSATAPIGTMPVPTPPPVRTPAEMGLNINFSGATLVSGEYVINLPSAQVGSAPAANILQLTSANVFHVVSITGQELHFSTVPGTVLEIGASSGYTNWSLGAGLPTTTVGTFDRLTSIIVYSHTAQTTIKLRIRGTITP